MLVAADVRRRPQDVRHRADDRLLVKNNNIQEFEITENVEKTDNININSTGKPIKVLLAFGNERFKQSRDRIIKEAQNLRKGDNTNETIFDNFIVETESIEKEDGFNKMMKQISI